MFPYNVRLSLKSFLLVAFLVVTSVARGQTLTYTMPIEPGPLDGQAVFLTLVGPAEEGWVTNVTMNLTFQTLAPIPLNNCAALIENWANVHSDISPIVCDVDRNNDNKGDIIWQYWQQAGCGGVPHNYYIDQAGVVYQFVCGGEVNPASIEAKIINEVNPETCE